MNAIDAARGAHECLKAGRHLLLGEPVRAENEITGSFFIEGRCSRCDAALTIYLDLFDEEGSYRRFAHESSAPFPFT